MKILLLGSTGRTGKLVLQELVNKRYTVNCIVRRPPGNTLPGVNFIAGNPDDSLLLEQAISGCDAIISVLNVSRTSDFPWAKLRTPENFLSAIMTNLIPLAQKNKVERLVVCSAWGVAETKKDIPGWFRWLIDHSNIGVAYADHERQEKTLHESGLKWTIVRPAALINTRKNQDIVESYDNKPKPHLTISRTSVARYIVDTLSNDSLIHQSPVVSAR